MRVGQESQVQSPLDITFFSKFILFFPMQAFIGNVAKFNSYVGDLSGKRPFGKFMLVDFWNILRSKSVYANDAAVNKTLN